MDSTVRHDRRAEEPRRPGRPRRASRRPLARLWALVAPLLLGACLPIPNQHRDLRVAPPAYRLPPSEVASEYVVYDGYPQPRTPPAFNRSAYLRYHVPGEETETVLLLMPGIFGGATSVGGLARQLVAASPGMEVWALDRRANLLEDRSGILASLRADDPMIAYRYYVERFGRVDGFRPLRPKEVPYLRDWGLRVHLLDLHRAVLRAREAAPVVVLGGHSLGASLVSFYAAYEVAPASGLRYGHEYLDGLLLLDGALGRTGGFDFEDTGFRLGPVRLTPTIAELEAGRGAPYADVGQFSPRVFAEREAIALLAELEPEEDAPPLLADFAISNRALAGVRNDDEYAATPIFSATVGEAVGAEFAGNLSAVLLSGTLALTSRTVVGVADGAARVEWRRTDSLRERTDLDAYLTAWTREETNYSEWYFPYRLALDVIRLDAALERREGFLPNRLVPVPTLAFGAGRGLIGSLTDFETYANARYGAPFSAYILPGLTHVDIVWADNNPVVPVFQRWLAFLLAAD